MTIQVFALQGFVCDRYSNRGMVGAGLVAAMLAEALNIPAFHRIGAPAPAQNIDYAACLKVADPQLRTIYASVFDATKAGHTPVIAANRCGATLASLSAGLQNLPPDTVLLWVDAHGDYHTPESTHTGYLGGMVISGLCGLWETGFPAPLHPSRVVLAGCRDLEENEKDLLNRDHVPVHWGRADGTVDVAAVIQSIAGRPVWLHVDCDVLDPHHITTEYKVAKGLTPEGLKELVTAICATSPLAALEITEFDAAETPEQQQADLATLHHIFMPAFSKLRS